MTRKAKGSPRPAAPLPIAIACIKLSQGLAFHQQGALAEAAALYSEILSSYPNNADCLHLLGVTKYQNRDFAQAAALIQKAIDINPDDPFYHNNMGLVRKDLKQALSALDCFERAIELKPDYPEAYLNQGNTLQDLRQFEASISSYNTAIELRPDNPDAFNNRGVARRESGQHLAAIDDHDRAIALRPGFAEAYSNRGLALKELNQTAAALASLERAIEIKPSYAEAYANLGNLLKSVGRLEKAIASYDSAIAIRPDFSDAQWNKALAHLLGGDFEHGWPLYEWRWKIEHNTQPRRSFVQPIWLGNESVSGKRILLHAEQGLGDTIQFCRYAKVLADAGAKVILEVQAPLLDLLRNIEGATQVIKEGDPLPDFDCHCPLLSLPLALNTKLDSIPASIPYIFADPLKVRLWSEKLGSSSAPRIGLVWRGAQGHRNDKNRSIQLSSLLPYLVTNCQFYSLQKDICDCDRQLLNGQQVIRHLGDQINDFSDTAALCQLMDRVICVDTSVAHLAAGLGCPTSILIPFHPDWRWLLHRDDSPWYPSAHLLRQIAPGDWSHPLDALRKQLIGL